MYDREIFLQLDKCLKTKSQNFLRANSYFCRDHRGKTRVILNRVKNFKDKPLRVRLLRGLNFQRYVLKNVCTCLVAFHICRDSN